jgi:hypothetical protein
MNPAECCNNAENQDICEQLADSNGNTFCNFVDGADASYCGGELCNETQILGIVVAKQCNAISGCQWFEEKDVSMCVYLDKCKYKTADECDAIEGCTMGDSSSGVETPDAGSEDEEGPSIQTLCRTDFANVASNADQCDATIGARMTDEDECNAADFCVWDSDGLDDEITSVAQSTGCRAVIKDDGAADTDTGGTPGGGGGVIGDSGTVGITFKNCEHYSDSAQCKKWLKGGNPRCSWYTQRAAGNVYTYCIDYNPCAVKGKAQCLANGCDFYEQFSSGQLVGQCRHPPSRFSEGNTTCVPFTSEASGDISESIFFGDNTEFLRTTTTIPTTRATTRKSTTTTTRTTTTRTTQQELPETKEDVFVAPVIDDKGEVTVQDVPVIAEEEEKFDYANYAVDMTWKPLAWYDELHDVQIEKITVDVESLLQFRLINLGISPIKIHFVIPYADMTDGDLYKQLTVRVTFRRGMLAKDVNELIHGMIMKPLEIQIAGRTGTFRTSIIAVVRDSGPNRKGMFFPTLSAQTIEDNTAVVGDNGEALSESEIVDKLNAIQVEIAAAEQARLDKIADALTSLAGQQVTADDVAGMTDEEFGDIANAQGALILSFIFFCV